MLTRLFSELFASAVRSPRLPRAETRRAQALAEVRALIDAKRLDEAERALDTLEAGEAAQSQVHLLRADLARKRGQLSAALGEYRAALAIDNTLADAWFGMGLCAFRSDDARHGHLYMRTAQVLRPHDADILNELGLVEHALGNFSCAQATFEQAAAVNPEHPEAWNNLGMIYAARGRVREAKRCFLRAVSIRTGFYTASCNLALACQQLEQLEEAEQHARGAISLSPGQHAAWLTLGAVLQDAGRLQEARAACGEAVRLAASDPDARTAHAGVLYRLGDMSSAEREYRSALTAQPAHAEAALGLAQLLIGEGRFAEGWELYEARLRARESPVRHFPYPACDGPILGRKLLVYGEQGAGEEILFASCLPEAMRDAQSVRYVANPRLEALFRRSFPGLELLTEADAMRAVPGAARFDCTLPVGSLLRLYRRSLERFPRHQGYLLPDAALVAQWRERLATIGAERVLGIAWRGGRASTGRALRSLQPEDFGALSRLEGCAFVCLQADATDEELERFNARGLRLLHWPQVHTDLDQTAALICALDGTVAAASTVVHLAGALGSPVWVLTPAATTWRYMARGSELPWYPSARLFRQREGEPWAEVAGRLAEVLAQSTCTTP